MLTAIVRTRRSIGIATLVLSLVLVVSGCSERDDITGPGGLPPGGQPPGGPASQFGVNRSSGDLPVSVSFTDRSTGTITSWSWDFGDGTTSTERNPTHTYTRRGRYFPKLTVTGPGGTSVNGVSGGITVDEVLTLSYGANAPRLGPFFPNHVEGDRDFNGHGPTVTCRAWLSAGSESDANQPVYLSYYMRARESQADWSTGERSWLNASRIYQVPAGFKVKQLLSPTAELVFLDGSHAYTNASGGELGGFSVMGDTDGNDIGNTTLDDTHMYFWPSVVRIRIGPK